MGRHLLEHVKNMFNRVPQTGQMRAYSPKLGQIGHPELGEYIVSINAPYARLITHLQHLRAILIWDCHSARLSIKHIPKLII